MIKRLIQWMALMCAVIVTVNAQETDGKGEAVRKWIEGLQFQTGEIPVGNGIAKLNVPATFKYLNSKDSAKYLQLLGNPPSEVLGILFPAESDLISSSTWFTVLEYAREGHVKDDDAAKIDYDKLLADMKEASKEENEQRAKKGYPKAELVGWAASPRYDASTHKLYWAKDLRFEGESSDTLNYNIRMLGREGVLVANVVGGMEDLSAIEQATPEILTMVDFSPGNRYQDYNAKTDHTAEYGIAGLIAGAAGLKIAAKAGILALFLKKAAVLWKAILVGFAAVVGGIKKFFGRKNAEGA
ncbi:MAG TPA: DUF2167 domain-containing protein [Luteolibacter sp.]